MTVSSAPHSSVSKVEVEVLETSLNQTSAVEFHLSLGLLGDAPARTEWDSLPQKPQSWEALG